MHGLKKVARYGVLLLCAAVLVVGQGCATGRSPWPEDQARSPKSVNRKSPPTIPSIYPVEKDKMYITSRFGSGRKGRYHKGVDMVTAKGTPVRTAANGVVTFAGRDGNYGNEIIVDHGDGLSTRYAHLDKEFAKEGQEVKRGEIIGAVGRTGNATTAHLHYEVRKDDKPVNPQTYLP